MERLIIYIILCIFLIGCSNKEIRTEFVDKPVPYIVVPPPPTLVRPSLATLELTEDEKKIDGEIAKAYVITVEQLLNYVSILEKIVARYEQLSKMSVDQRAAINKRVEQLVKDTNNSKTYFEILDQELSRNK
jgi:hypothetical protein